MQVDRLPRTGRRPGWWQRCASAGNLPTERCRPLRRMLCSVARSRANARPLQGAAQAVQLRWRVPNGSLFCIFRSGPAPGTRRPIRTSQSSASAGAQMRVGDHVGRRHLVFQGCQYAFKKSRETAEENRDPVAVTGSICGCHRRAGFPVKFGQVSGRGRKSGVHKSRRAAISRTFVTAAFDSRHLDLQIATLQRADSVTRTAGSIRREETRIGFFPDDSREQTLVEWAFPKASWIQTPRGFFRSFQLQAAAEVVFACHRRLRPVRIGVVGGRQVYAHGAAPVECGLRDRAGARPFPASAAVDRPGGFHFVSCDQGIGRK